MQSAFAGGAQYRISPFLGSRRTPAHDTSGLPFRSPLLSYLTRHPPPPTLTLDDAISALFLERIAAPSSASHSGLANTLAALRWAGNNLGLHISPKFRIHDTIVRARPVANSALQWLHPTSLAHIASHDRNGASDDLCTCRNIFSVFHALRVSEACRVRPSDFIFREGERTQFIIRPSKGAPGPQAPRPVIVPLHPAAEPWAELFCITASRFPGSPALNPTSAFLNHWLRDQLRTTRDAGASWIVARPPPRLRHPHAQTRPLHPGHHGTGPLGKCSNCPPLHLSLGGLS
eukprot:gene16197-biopygen723